MSTFTAADFFEAQEAEVNAALNRAKQNAGATQQDPEGGSVISDNKKSSDDIDQTRGDSSGGHRAEQLRRSADGYRYGSDDGSQDARSPRASANASRHRVKDSREREERDSNGTSANKSRPGREADFRSRSRSPESTYRGARDRGGSYRDRSQSTDRQGSRIDYDDRPRSRRDNNSYRPSPARDIRDNTRRRDYGRLEPVNDDDFKDRRSDATPPRAKERSQEEKDRSTVFVQQVANRCREKDLDRFFTKRVGAVRAVQIVRDRVSQRSKGIAYVEFESEASVEEAIKLTGQKLLDVPIIVQATESEKNRRAKVDPQPSSSNGIPFFRLYVGNIHFSVGEDDLEGVFASFGQLEFVHLQREEGGRSKGFAFIQYVNHDDAKEALEKLQGFELAGRAIRVGLGNQSQRDEMAQESQPKDNSASTFGRGGRGTHAGGTGVFDRANGRDADKTGGASALDDNDLGGVNYSNYSREALMQKLSRNEPAQKPAKQQTAQVAAPEVVTRCICLKNMWGKKDTEEPNWQTDLSDDVGKECNDKYGIVVWVGIDPSSTEGEIYVKFDRPEGGKNAYRGLNGRFFGGRTITASYIVDAVYDAMFPKAAKV